MTHVRLPAWLLAALAVSCSPTTTRSPNDSSDESARNVAVVTDFLNDVVSGGRLDRIDQFWTADMLWHNGDYTTHGRDAYEAQMKAAVGKAFVDMHLEILGTVATKDTVVVRFTNSGRHVGTFLGYAPTQKFAKWHGIGIYRLDHGKIAEAWFAEDMLGMLQQLGLAEPANAKGAELR